MKTIKTTMACLVILFAFVLWLTRTVDHPSQSAAALAPNSQWYYLMHLSIMFTFITDWITHPKRWLNLVPFVFSALTVYFDMYTWPVAHNWCTAGIMAGAIASLITHAPSIDERINMILVSFVAAMMFPIGMFTPVPLFHTETIAEFCVGVGLVRRFWYT